MIAGSQAIGSQEPGGLTGSVWLCRGFRLKNDLFGAPKSKKHSVSFTPKDGDYEEDKEDAGDKEEKGEEEEQNKNDKPSPRRDINEQNDGSSKTEICPLYKKRMCPHGSDGQTTVEGNTCQYAHPRRCVKFCRFGKKKGGCNKGPECKQYHPVLCKFSLRTGKCFNSECTYTHLKGTKRNKQSDREDRTGQQVPKRYYATGNNQLREERPARLRRDSTTSVDSRSSAFRTPFTRDRKNSERQFKSSATPAQNNFLEKLMENMKEGFSQQKTEFALMKEAMDKQITALWKQLGSTNQTNLPQIPTFPPYQLPNHITAVPQAPWNTLQNQCSMY
jgi:hypothetical protein